MDTPKNPADEMTDCSGELTEQITAFQRIWMETISRLVQSAVTLPRDSAPPEVMRQMRSGVFQGLAKSWDEYLRSPQFLESMKQWNDAVIYLRRIGNEMMTRGRHEMQATAREDIDTAMLAVRHMEKRLLDRIEQLEAKIDALTHGVQTKGNGGPASNVAPSTAPAQAKGPRAKKTRKTPPRARKVTL